MAIFNTALEKAKADLIVYQMKIDRLERMAKQLEEQGILYMHQGPSKQQKLRDAKAFRTRGGGL